MTDIALALEAGYPTHMIYKLYIRKCKCLLELCRIPDAQEAFDKAIDAIDRSGLKKDLRKVCINFYYFFKKGYMQLYVFQQIISRFLNFSLPF